MVMGMKEMKRTVSIRAELCAGLIALWLWTAPRSHWLLLLMLSCRQPASSAALLFLTLTYSTTLWTLRVTHPLRKSTCKLRHDALAPGRDSFAKMMMWNEYTTSTYGQSYSNNTNLSSSTGNLIYISLVVWQNICWDMNILNFQV